MENIKHPCVDVHCVCASGSCVSTVYVIVIVSSVWGGMWEMVTCGGGWGVGMWHTCGLGRLCLWIASALDNEFL